MKYQNCAAVAQAPDEPLDLGAGLRLEDANINPATGLATDYLNRFNEAVMLLDMLATCPEFRDDFLSWKPMSYREHFHASHSRTRDLAIALTIAGIALFGALISAGLVVFRIARRIITRMRDDDYAGELVDIGPVRGL